MLRDPVVRTKNTTNTYSYIEVRGANMVECWKDVRAMGRDKVRSFELRKRKK